MLVDKLKKQQSAQPKVKQIMEHFFPNSKWIELNKVES